MANCRDYLRRPFRWAHILWALFAVSAWILLFAIRGGHPPPMVLVPVVVAVWVVVHLALCAGRWLAVRGLFHASAAGKKDLSWPPGLIVVLIATAAATFLGFLQLVVTAMSRGPWPFRGAQGTILLMMGIWLAHAVCLTGLLLRRLWARWAAAMLCIGWALRITWETLGPALRGYPQPMQIAIAFSVAALLALTALHLLRSKRIQAFLA